MLIRRESSTDLEAIRAVHSAAFAEPAAPDRVPDEVGLVDALRTGDAWLPELSLVALAEGSVITGHVVCTRAHVGGAPVLALGPIGVVPERQRQGVGEALMHAVLGAADGLGEPLVGLLGDTEYYPRFGFHPADDYRIEPPVADWADHFQVRTLTTYATTMRGEFTYAPPFLGA